MEYLIAGIFALLSAVLLIFLKKKDNQIKLLREQLKEAQNRGLAIESKTSETEALCHMVWKYGNMVHLYASLTEEEAGMESIKEKQKEILTETEKVLEQVEKLI